MSHTTQAFRRQTATRCPLVSKASFSDNEDAITPCSSPPPEPQHVCCHQQPQRFPSFGHSLIKSDPKSAISSPKTSTSAQAWHFDPTHGQDMSDSELWQRMLDIQRNFHCYNSARMSAALLELEMGVDAGHLAPSRSCLDLMNESVSDMSGVERQRLGEWLEEHSSSRRGAGALWKRAAVFH